MPICPYQCINCLSYQELLVDSPIPQQMVGGECELADGDACLMVRVEEKPKGAIKDIFVGEWDEDR